MVATQGEALRRCYRASRLDRCVSSVGVPDFRCVSSVKQEHVMWKLHTLFHRSYVTADSTSFQSLINISLHCHVTVSSSTGRRSQSYMDESTDKTSAPNSSSLGCGGKPQETAVVEAKAGEDNGNSQMSSKYKTVSYRRIRKGNTRQRIDEFEAMTNM